MPFGFGFKFGFGRNQGGGIVYRLLCALNATNANPLTALKGTTVTESAASAVVIPDNTGVLNTVPAGYPVVLV